VKATIEPDGKRYIEIHNPLSSNQEEFDSQQPLPITLTGSASSVAMDPAVNQTVVQRAIEMRSGMPVQVN
jgi:L,D-transpeptidase YbiS